MPLDYKEIIKFSKFRNPLNDPSVVFRKTHVQESSSYHNLLFFEDYNLWVRMLGLGYEFKNLD